MVARVATVAFEGIEARAVDVQVQIAPGGVAFVLVGLPDKAVAESRERVRAALLASGLALPAKRVTVNLAPADLPKEGSHYDLPIALAVMAAIGALPADALSGYAVLGELALDGSIAPVAGVLPAAIAAYAKGQGLICPAASGPEAAWAAADIDILAPRSLIQLANHFKGTQVMARPEPAVARQVGPLPDLADVKGQESARRVLEIAAAGGHNLVILRPLLLNQLNRRLNRANAGHYLRKIKGLLYVKNHVSRAILRGIPVEINGIMKDSIGDPSSPRQDASGNPATWDRFHQSSIGGTAP